MNTMDKSNKYLSQLQIVKDFLYRKPATRLETAAKTGVPLQNICYYISKLRKQNKVTVVKSGMCPISGKQAEFLSTNPVYFKEYGKQMSLF